MRGRSILRVGAVCSSMLLVGGYVFYSVGGTVFPSSKSGRIAPSQEDTQQQAVLPGSKSFPITIPASGPTTGSLTLQPDQPTATPSTQPDGSSYDPHPVFISGSKSGIIFKPPQPTAELPPPLAQPTTAPSTRFSVQP